MMKDTSFSRKLAATADKYGKERDYWLEKLSGEWVKSRFPGRGGGVGLKGRRADGPGKRDAVEFRFSGDIYCRLIMLSGESDALLHVLLTAGLILLLDKYTYKGNKDIIIGSPILRQTEDAVFVNTVLVLRNRINGRMTFKELLLQVKETIAGAAAHVNYPVESLILKLNLSHCRDEFPLFDIALLVENIHDKEDILFTHPIMIFSFKRTGKDIEGRVEYDPLLYGKTVVERIVDHYTHLLCNTLFSVDKRLSEVEILSEEEKKQVLFEFNNTRTEYPGEKTIGQLFAEQAERLPGKTAVVYEGETVTYGELEVKAGRLANYLYYEKNIRPDDCVGILMDKCIDLAAAILGVLKAGGAYIPIDHDFPEERIKYVINDGAVGVVVSRKKFIKLLNRLQWDCPSFHTFLCLDSRDIYLEEEAEKSELMEKKLWEYVGETAGDEITGGGWISSYTGEPLSRKEMDEYGDNILEKLTPLLHKRMRVLEIGCASGISMYRLAPRVGYYYGTDLSHAIIRKNRERIQGEGHENIVLSCLAAHEIGQINETGFHLVIINSVIQCFHGHNYLRRVIAGVVEKIGERGYVFIGDVMDRDLKEDLIRDMREFKHANRDRGYKTKIDWSVELFISRKFFEDLAVDIPGIQGVEFSDKIYTVENELTRYRFDTLIKIDKTGKAPGRLKRKSKHKYQHDAGILDIYGRGKLPVRVEPGNLAYIMYTSGSTGNPKGVMVEHGSVVRLVKNSNYLEFREEDKILQTGALAFDASTFEIWGALLNGMSLYLLSKEKILTPGALKKALRDYGIGTMWMTSPLFNRILEEDIEIFAGLRNLLVGGDVLSAVHINRLKRCFPRLKVINGYGPTENTTFSTTHLLEKEYEGVIPIGKPISNSTAYIVDENNRLQPIGVSGELVVGGDGAARGYLNNPELTAEKFIYRSYRTYRTYISKRIYKTGDLARWLADGNIELLGRVDFQVKVRGFRVELEEIENHLKAIDSITGAVVVAGQTGGAGVAGDKYLCGYVVSAEEVVSSEIKEQLSKTLPGYMVPAYIVRVEKMPLTSNGKVDRKALPAPVTGEVGEGLAVPENEIQEQLQVLWARVLGLEPGLIGIDANFFELGGHSLRATTLVSLVRKEFNVEFPLSRVFSGPSIKEFDHFIRAAKKSIYEEIVPVEECEYYPQSSAQKRLFFLDQFETVGTAYNMPSGLKTRGKPDNQRYERAAKALIARHESLRTSFHLENNQPVQRIHPTVDFEIGYYDLEGFVHAFDLSKAPLFRLGFVQLSPDEHLLVYDMHHIIGDGTSLEVLIKDFLSFYSGSRPGPLKIQYKDFSCWQNHLPASERIKEIEAYWLDLYGDAPGIPKLNLPLDYPRPAVFSFAGDDYYWKLEGEEVQRFKAVGSQQGLTLFMKLLTVFGILLFKYTGQEDIIIGCDIAGRPHADLQTIIGMFVNELAMRTYPCGEKSCMEFLAEVKETSIRAFEHQDLQFEELVDKLDLERDPSRNPLFDVEFAFQNFERYSRAREFAASISQIGVVSPAFDEVRTRTAKFDIALDAFEEKEAILFRFQYCTGLFKRTTIQRLANHFVNILREIINNPGIQLSGIFMLSAREKEQILFEFNDTKRDFPRESCYHRLFEEQAARAPDAVGVVGRKEGSEEPVQLTYRELNEKSNQLAHYLCEETSIQANEPVGILLERSVEFLVSILGIMKAGGFYVPLEASLPEKRIRTIIDDAEIGVVISQGKYAGVLNRLQWECGTFHTFLLLDSKDGSFIKGIAGEGLKDSEELWEYIGETAEDEITAGGWFSSFTGEPFSGAEMAEYGGNILQKVMPLLHKRMRVLEIGCASGISMYRIAPHVGCYYGIDFSDVIIRENKKRVQEEGRENIVLSCLAAHEIDKIQGGPFDLIILNSVIQSFHGHDYLREVIGKAVDLAEETSYIFVGDVMDLELKNDLIRELTDFKRANRDKNYRTKTDFSAELFLSRGFFEDLTVEFPGIKDVEFSDKIYTIENELTRFRFDALLRIDKSPGVCSAARGGRRHKYRHDLRQVEKYGTGSVKTKTGPDNLVYMIYTSGTTGKPKGVMIHHRGMLNHLFAKINDLAVTRGDIIAQTAPACFDISVWQFLAALLKGGRTLIIGREVVLEPLRLLNMLQKRMVTIFETVPSLMAEFLETVKHEGDNRLEYLRWMMPTGEALTTSLVSKWYRHYPAVKLINAYGPTEAADDVTHYVVNEIPDESQQTISIGRPLQNTHIYILDRNLSLCPIGVRGEICVAGAGVGKGYWKDKEKTGKAFVPNPYLAEIGDGDYGVLYKTGDIGYSREDGRIECLGRLDHQVKVRGNRIELGEIESRLTSYDGIKEAVVIPREDKNGDKYLCAYIVPASSGAAGLLAVSDIRDYLDCHLPDYMIPLFYVQMEKIPLTANGKLDRKSLPGPEAGGERGDFTAPRDKIEEGLAGIWSEVLGLEKGGIGIDTDFFEIGGHSLKATSMVSAVHRELQVKIPIAEVFKTPNIRGLAGYIRGAKKEEFAAAAPVEEREYYEVSSSQKRMFILSMFIDYSMPFAAVIEEKIDKRRFQEVFRELVKRHESLRTSFEMIEGDPVQRIHEAVEFKIEYYQEECGAHRTGIVKNFFRPFDLSLAPLFRVGLIKLSGGHLFLFNIHHIVSDGLTLGILAREFAGLYRGNELPELKTRYRDFSLWQNRLLKAGEYKKQEVYWLERFSGVGVGEVPVLNMPFDYPRPAVQGFEGRRLPFVIEGETFRALRKPALSGDASLFMVLLAVYNTLLFRYTGQEDIVIGTITAGREQKELETLVGVFINALAMRNFPGRDKTFAGFLRELKQDTLDAFENRLYPFGDLVEKVVKKKDVGRSPLFDVMLIFQNLEMVRPQAGGLRFLPYQPEHEPMGHSQHDMTLWAVEEEERIVIGLEYCTALFKQETMERFAGHFVTLLRGAVTNPQLKLPGIEMMDEGEKRQVLEQFNGTVTVFPGWKSIGQLFEEQAEKSGDGVAVVCGVQGVGAAPRGRPGMASQHLTYKELNRKCGQLAYLLREKGVGPGSIVGLTAERCIEMFVGVLGVLKGGGAYLPIDPDLPEERIKFMLADSGVRILLSELGEVSKWIKGCEVVGFSDFTKEAVTSPARLTGPTHPCYVIYTSGSTGRPKGVVVQHDSFVNAAYAWAKEYRLQEMEVCLLQMAGFSFDVFSGDIARALLFGGKLIICPGEVRLDLESLYCLVRNQGITLFESTPGLIVPFMDYVYENALNTGDLRLLILGSDTCPVEDFRRLVSRFGDRMRIVNSYGVTEATIDTSYYEAGHGELPPGGNVPIGRPLANMYFYILDAEGNPLPVGVPGELYIGGVGVARGYLNNPELTAERFLFNKKFCGGPGGGFSKEPPGRRRQKLYKTGDLARWLADGSVEFLGRIDLQVKIRGFRIELGELEKRLLDHKGIKEAVVAVREKEQGDRYLCAYLVPRSAGSLDLKELKECLARELPGYMVPSYFVPMDKIPLDHGGKVDRKALPGPETGVLPGDYAPPRDELETKLTAIWAEVLQISRESTGIDGNFFELGGHSLKAARAAARIHKELNVKLSMTTFFAHGTIRRLAGYIRETAAIPGEAFAPMEILEQREYYNLSHGQLRLWTLSQFEGASLTFNMQDVQYIRGDLDETAFEKALETLVQRHESLRTVFIAVNHQPGQKILSPEEMGSRWERILIDSIDGHHRDGEPFVREIADSESGRLFDLAAGPLLRVKLIRLEEKQYVFLLTMHHIIGDAISMQVFFYELFLLYEGYRVGRGNPLPALRVQYRDYARWQNRQVEEEINPHRHYWLRRLEGNLPPLELSIAGERPGTMTYNGATIALPVPGDLTDKLKALGRKHGASLFMVLVAALKVLFYRYSGQTDIILGFTGDDRKHADLHHQIGFYINTLALRTRFHAGDSFDMLVEKVRTVILSAFEHKDYPFDMLVEELGLKRDPGRHPVFDVVVDMINFNQPGTGAVEHSLNPGLTVTPLDVGHNKSKFDLTVYIFEGGDSLGIRLEYNVDIFEAGAMNRLAQRFRVLLSSVVGNPGAAVSQLEVDRAMEFPVISPVSGEETPIPASYHQERLWFIDRFEAGNLYESSPVYHNVPLILKINGVVDRDKLEQGIRETAHCHPALRTRIITLDNSPYQWISGKREFDSHFKLEYRRPGAEPADAVSLVLAEAGRPFLLDKEFLIRGGLFEIAAKKYLFVLTLHHIIVDRRSLELLPREILSRYDVLAGNGSSRLSFLPLGYADFSQWQRGFSRELVETLLFYWQGKLRGPVQALELPTDRPRAAVHVYRGAGKPLAVAAPLAHRLNLFCKNNGMTMFTFLLAVFKVLLHRYSSQEEIVVGTGADNRNQPGSAEIIGPIANLLVLRSHIPGTSTFMKVAADVAQTVKEAYKYRAMPFDRLVSELNPRKDMSRTALFDVLFQYEDTPVQLPVVEDWEMEIEEINQGWGKYDLNVLIQNKGDFLSGVLVYNALYYNDDTIGRLVNHYPVLMESVLEAPNRSIAGLPLLTGKERRQLLIDWNRTGAGYPEDKTIHQLFEEQAVRTPDGVAVVCGGEGVGAAPRGRPGMASQHLTYKELNRKSHRLAHLLIEKGVLADSIVAIKMDRSIDMIIGILGILKAGGAYLPIDADYPEERKQYMLADSGARVLLKKSEIRIPKFETNPNDQNTNDRNKMSPYIVLNFEHLNFEFVSDFEFRASNLRPFGLAYIIYTSGTTGRPKGCMISHRNLVRLFRNEKHPFDFGAGDVWIMAHSYCFDFSVWEMYGALLNGGKLIVPRREAVRDVNCFLSLIVKHGVTVLNQTPQAFYHLAGVVKKEGVETLASHLRYVIFGGDKLEPAYLKEWVLRYPLNRVQLVNMYGITETTVHVTIHPLAENDIRASYPVSPIGKALPETTIYIFNGAMRLQPVGVPGEMYVGGSGVARGYLNRPQLTAEKFLSSNYRSYRSYRTYSLNFSKKIYKTGDLARWLAAGALEYLGRIDHQVKVRGFRIEVGEIENQLLNRSDIKEAVVIARKGEKGDTYLCAYVVPYSSYPAISVDVSGLKAYLAGVLPDYMIPAYFLSIGRIPLTPNGKLDRRALPEPEMKSGETYAAPRDEIEKKLVYIWMEVLNLPGSHGAVGIDDDFFELGGHSLKATLLTAGIHKAFDVNVRLADIFTTPTIRGLAVFIKDAAKNKYACIEAVEEREYYPLSSAQKGVFLHQALRRDTAYNSVQARALGGELDKEKFQETVKKLIRRHEGLRTSFGVVNGEPVQRIHAPGDVPFEIEYYNDLATMDSFIRPFDLSRPPLLRVGLLGPGEAGHVLVLDMHHIITDGVSQEILVRDFILLYEALELAALKIQYRDYALWSCSAAVIEEIEGQKAYWLKQFEKEIPVLHMPRDFKRPAKETFAGEMLTVGLGKELSEKLDRLAVETGTTLYMVLLAAYYILLFKYTGQEDMVVGSPVTGRRRVDLQNIIGMFVNMLAIRGRPAAGKTFGEFLGEVKETVIQAVENQDFHFEELVTGLGLPGDPGKNPLFAVVFAMQNVDIEGNREEILPSGDLYHLKVTPYEFQHHVSQFDLILGAFQGLEFITLDLRYATTLFKRSSAEKIIDRFIEVLEQIVENNKVRLKDILLSHELVAADSTLLDEDEEEGFEL